MVDPGLLADIPLFADLTAEERDRVATWLERRGAEAGERLCGEGATGYSFFVLREGAATVTQDGRDLGSLAPGDFFGELAILGDGRRTATVTANEPSELLVMYGTEFRRLERELPQAAERLRAAIAGRVS